MINIFGKIFLRDSHIGLNGFNKKLRHEFAKIREEFEEHLQAINENTNEISANYEYICEIEIKLDKLSERVDNLQMYLQSNSGISLVGKADFDVKRLNRREQEVFLVIYTIE